MERALALLALPIVLGACTRASSAAETAPVDGTVVVDASSNGPAVPDDFLGISTEWWVVPLLLGDGAGGAEPVSVALMRAFEAEGHQLVVRVGGDSTDQAWWNPGGAPRPTGVSIDVTEVHMAAMAAVHAALGTRFVLGLDLALDDSRNAAALARAARTAMGADAVVAFELGNEPDRYASTGARPATYDFTSYIADVESFHDAIAARLPAEQAFAGPALASRRLLPQLLAYLPKEKERLALVTTHAYALPGCDGATYAPSDLLTDAATQAIADTFAPVVSRAHGDGQRVRMGETNSVSCGGATGVSDVYAAALWGADLALTLASIGYDGLNFHTPGTYAVWDWTVHPLYYGMRFASLGLSRHARGLTTRVSAPGRVRAWSMLGDDGAVRVSVLNEQARAVSLRLVAGARGTPTTVRLRGPALAARTGITLAGQTWDGSTDGQPMGAWLEEPLPADDDGWRLALAPFEGAVVTLPAP